MKTLTLETLLQERDRKAGQVPTPEIEPGSYVYVAQLTPDERDLMETQFVAHQEETRGDESARVGFRKFVFAYCLADEKNERLLDPGTDEGAISVSFVTAMNQMGANVPCQVVARAFDLACKKMGLTQSDQDELVKNSGRTPGDGASGLKPQQQEPDEQTG